MITKKIFGSTPNGKQAALYTLKSETGFEASVTDLGGTIVSIVTKDKSGENRDVLLGYNSIEGYFPNVGYMSALIGRVGNRIAKGECEVSGKKLALAKNSNGQHLHGGNVGYDHIIWDAKTDEANNSLILTHFSPDGDEGYPGNLTIKVTYTVMADALEIHYEAQSDKDTLINLTNHAYFNLSGETEKITDHFITINADCFTPVDSSLIPSGEIKKVDSTPFDLRTAAKIGDRLDKADECEQMHFGGGFDHNFCLNGEGLRDCIKLYCPATGIEMTVVTDQPGVQFYTANMLKGVNVGKGGKVYQKNDGLCLETQNYPDAVNHPNFPKAVYKAGEKYSTKTIFKFRAV